MSLLEIRRGATRTVLVTKKYAIKVPRLQDCKGYKARSFVRGWAANMSEADWHSFANSNSDVPQVCPVIKSFFWNLINVYPRAEVCTEYNDSFEESYDNLEFKTPSDMKPGNFGWWNGYFVWLDYDMNWNDCKRCGT